jgi:hypothetical protein
MSVSLTVPVSSECAKCYPLPLMGRLQTRGTHCLIAFSLCFFTCVASFAQSSEQRTATYFTSVRSNPLLLGAFLREMPKGGDLHNHLSGAVYAESYIQFAVADKLCVDAKSMSFVPQPCD